MPPFLPYLGTLSQLDQAIQAGLGVVASVTGQPMDVYRLGPTTTNSIVTGTPTLASFPVALRETTVKAALENTIFALQAFIADCDDRPLELGDALVTTGYESDGGTFYVARRRPMQELILMRAEQNAFVSRTMTRAGAVSQQPTGSPRAVSMPDYGGTFKPIEQTLTLTDGLFSFSTTPGATPASVPCGLQPHTRIRDASQPKLPTALYREQFFAYLPLLPGEQINELDRLNFSNSDRYEVMSVYSSDQVGLNGYICIIEKLGV